MSLSFHHLVNAHQFQRLDVYRSIFQLNPQYIAVRTAIVQAVEPYPEAREAISQAMLELEESNGLG